MDVIDKAKKELTGIQAKKISIVRKGRKKGCRLIITIKKRQRNEILGWLIVISTHIGKVNQYFVDDPTGNTNSKI